MELICRTTIKDEANLATLFVHKERTNVALNSSPPRDEAHGVQALEKLEPEAAIACKARVPMRAHRRP
eukprot:8763069-Lingulodinium_polyedra.AAC.1